MKKTPSKKQSSASKSLKAEAPLMPTAEQLAMEHIHLFLQHYNITNDQGDVLNFSQHPFLWDVYSDFSPRIAILKAAQLGFSTTIIHKALYLAKQKKMDIIYSLPTQDDARAFVSGKVNRLIANNPIYQKWTEDHDTIEQKKIGESLIYFRGTFIEKAAIMIPADLYISDETDRSKQETVKLFQSRLQHSKYSWEWYFSNPSAPNNGVDLWWQKSDQKHWFLKCDSCNHWGFITMENIMGSPPYFGCSKCKKELNRDGKDGKGEWVARWKDKNEVSGYWLPLLICPWVSAQEILYKKESQPEEQFTNFVLGLPFVGKGNTLTQQGLFQNLTSEINPQDTRPIIGVDNGSKITVVMGNSKGLFYNALLDDFSVLEQIMVRFPNAMMCIDPHGNEIPSRKLQERFPGRVYRVYSTTPRNSDQIAKWNDTDKTVLIDRDKIIQLVVDEFTEKRIPLQGQAHEWMDYWKHWSRLYRTVDENEMGIQKFHWSKSDIPCDFPFATFYWRVMFDRFAESAVSFAEPTRNAAFAIEGMEISAKNQAVFQPKWLIHPPNQ